LAEADQILSGSITNTLGFTLEGGLLAYGKSMYELAPIKPGESVRFGPTSKRSSLKTFLTGFKTVSTDTGNKFRQDVTPYDRASADIPYILRAMMFYKAAGGHRYTGLWNEYQGFVDLSTLLDADRAILIAQRPAIEGKNASGAELLRDGQPLCMSQDQHLTIYRFVFPVKKSNP
jgi:hypothetical protein